MTEAAPTYVLGQAYRRCDVGLAGNHKVLWLACEECGVPRFTSATNPTARCRSCTSKRMRKILDLNQASHRDDCKCYRCRIGKGYFIGKNNPSWNGGKIRLSSGYVAVWVSPDDPMYSMAWGRRKRDRHYCLEHRLVMARHVGRPLEKHEQVHHMNGVKDDNRIENLELWYRAHPSGVRASDVEEE